MNKDEMRRMLSSLEALFVIKQTEPKMCRIECINPGEALALVSKLMQELDSEEPKKEVTDKKTRGTYALKTNCTICGMRRMCRREKIKVSYQPPGLWRKSTVICFMCRECDRRVYERND